MNKELDYDTHNDSIIRSMSTAPKMFLKWILIRKHSLQWIWLKPFKTILKVDNLDLNIT